MKANELRIGNYLNTIYGIKRVSDISVDRWCWFLDSKVEPITLTEEWLLKLGFDFGSDFIGECFFIEFDDKNDFFIHIENDKFYYNYDEIEIKHVHQLQNLYFALTNNELEIL